MSEKTIAIFGSTGSIGTQALEILDHRPDLYKVEVLSARNNYKLLADQANRFKPDCLVLANDEYRDNLKELLNYRPEHLIYGSEALEQIAEEFDYDLLLNALVGSSGFMSTYAALRRGKRVALANKESLVVGGELLSRMDAFKKGHLIPVDSEHSAMLQCIEGESLRNISKIIITASGGPFWNYPREKMEQITVEDALNHPNWDMGSKITIDSSTMMNKGLEIIEARWFFSISMDSIKPVIHPQSIIHSIIEFVDGSSKAQLGPPDMKVPILYALTYPDRISYPNETLNYAEPMNLEFFPVDHEKFPCVQLATDAGRDGGFAPAILNASNEIAVERFLNREIRYIDIPKIIDASLNKIDTDKDLSAEALLEVDEETRNYARSLTL